MQNIAYPIMQRRGCQHSYVTGASLNIPPSYILFQDKELFCLDVHYKLRVYLPAWEEAGLGLTKEHHTLLYPMHLVAAKHPPLRGAYHA